MWTLLFLLAVEPEFVRLEPATLKIEEAEVRVGTFLIGRTEVTQDEYQRVMKLGRSGQLPVTNVTWFDAVRYANRRSTREGLRPCYDLQWQRVTGCNGYRLPTGAEWSIAATSAELDIANLRSGGHSELAELAGALRPAGTRPGLQDLYGNVWEWCEDWYSPEPLLDALRDPQGPLKGTEKLLRGGSYLSSRSQWNKGFVTSRPPEQASPFTGFRLARTLSPAAPLPPPDSQWLAQFQHTAAGAVKPIAPNDGPEIRQAWTRLLGLAPRAPPKAPQKASGVPAVHLRQRYEESTWRGQLLDLDVEPGFPARILVMEPARKPTGRLPVVIVPYYDVDSPAGENLGGRRSGGGVRAFAKMAAQRGYLAVAIRWFGEGDAEGYDEAVARLAGRHPGMTGMAKWILDAQRLVDYLVSRPDVDPQRIAIIGHSLGGKMALYAAAFEPRLAVIVSSEPGISLGFSNYEAFWYLGKQRPQDRDQQELLALIAPRPFLLIAGESSDGAKSWPYLAAAQPVYAAIGNKLHLGMINHGQGHTPTAASVRLAMDWLERFLGR